MPQQYESRCFVILQVSSIRNSSRVLNSPRPCLSINLNNQYQQQAHMPLRFVFHCLLYPIKLPLISAFLIHGSTCNAFSLPAYILSKSYFVARSRSCQSR